jgi:ubiquinone/menaquinone biosynthesis C-methylase UbiE
MRHEEQQKYWDEEHRRPSVLPQMDSREPSGGVERFWRWVSQHLEASPSGIEMGCGKGRNAIWLAKQGARMRAFDFSPFAIEEARRRAQEEGISVAFECCDATERWPYADARADFVVDCFASTDIESKAGRVFACTEARRVLRKGGVLFVYTLSTEEEFHASMAAIRPAQEPHSFTYPNGKFEKAFSEPELRELYGDFRWLEEQRIEKMVTFFDGKQYRCRHFWLVLER